MEWSNGPTTQTIEVTSGGTYNVSIVDVCGNTGTSAEAVAELYESPGVPPTLSDITVDLGNDAIFTAVGENIRWYDSEFEGNQIGDGPSYTAVELTNELTVWASQTTSTIGDLAVGGELDTQEGGQFHTNSQRWLEFDVYEDVVLKSVTVYAQGEYERTFHY